MEDKHGVRLTMSKTQDYNSDRRNITCAGRMASIMAAKHEIDLKVAESANGETSIITYQNDTITGADEGKGKLIRFCVEESG